ncbi:Hypothetical protein NTJ_09402 [Nesidiocoris tenuis]|uniref:C2H2-type domain-containing protein n=1 Tax=Nesidiocoris tenuis TaxID=355587 RepID=A0ABN7AWN1_9HEMI|nr:Hypothetical protein NTJ_09402 [Nesidiocoris tenuis]
MEIVDLCDDSDDDQLPEQIDHHANSWRTAGEILERKDTVGSTRMKFTVNSTIADTSNIDDRCSTFRITDTEECTMPKIDAYYSVADDPSITHDIKIIDEQSNFKGEPNSSCRPTAIINAPESYSTNYPESPESMESAGTAECPTPASPQPAESSESCFLEPLETTSPVLSKKPSLALPQISSLESPESPPLDSPESPSPEPLSMPLKKCPESSLLESPESPSMESPESPSMESPESPSMESPESPSMESPESPPPELPDLLESPSIRCPGADVEGVIETHENPKLDHQNLNESQPLGYATFDKTTDLDSEALLSCNDLKIDLTDDQDPLAGVEVSPESEMNFKGNPDNDLDFIPTFNCLYCEFTTSVEHAYHNHLKTHLPGSKPYTRLYCPECDYTTGTKKFLVFHRYKTHKIFTPGEGSMKKQYLMKRKKNPKKKNAENGIKKEEVYS